MKNIIKAFNIPAFEMAGYEADDIICSLAKKAAAEGVSVYILTGDKDMTQIVGKNIRIYDPMKESVIEEKDVLERYGVPPGRMSELMALMGDASDNIPGVKGIGEKTARELLANTSLDELIEHPEKIKNERLRKMLSESLDSIKLSRTLATINADLPVEADIAALKKKEPDWPALLEIFSKFELTSMIKMIPAKGHKQRAEYITITDAGQLRSFLGIKA
jgi:DNA polymerase I